MSICRNARLMIILAAAFMLGTALYVQAQDAAPAPTTQASGGATGTWKWNQAGPGGDREVVLTLKQDGDKVTGTITGFQGPVEIQEGKVSNGEVTFKTTADFGDTKMVTTYTGKIDGESFKGKSEMKMSRDFEAKKSKS